MLLPLSIVVDGGWPDQCAQLWVITTSTLFLKPGLAAAYCGAGHGLGFVAETCYKVFAVHAHSLTCMTPDLTHVAADLLVSVCSYASSIHFHTTQYIVA